MRKSSKVESVRKRDNLQRNMIRDTSTPEPNSKNEEPSTEVIALDLKEKDYDYIVCLDSTKAELFSEYMKRLTEYQLNGKLFTEKDLHTINLELLETKYINAKLILVFEKQIFRALSGDPTDKFIPMFSGLGEIIQNRPIGLYILGDDKNYESVAAIRWFTDIIGFYPSKSIKIFKKGDVDEAAAFITDREHPSNKFKIDANEINKLSEEQYRRKVVEYAITNNIQVYQQRHRVMFVGNGRAGKTSTINSLMCKESDKKEISTEVINQAYKLELSMLTAKYRHGVWKISRNKQDKMELDIVRGTQWIVSDSRHQHELEEFESSKPQQFIEESTELLTKVWNPEAVYQEQAERYFEILDYGGQSTYSSIHCNLLGVQGICCITFNAAKLCNSETYDNEAEEIAYWIRTIQLKSNKSRILFVATNVKAFNELHSNDVSLRLVDQKIKEICLDSMKDNGFGQIQLNDEDGLLIHPMENLISQDETKKQYIRSLRRSLENAADILCKQTRTDSMVPLSWIFFFKNLNMNSTFVELRDIRDKYKGLSNKHLNFDKMMEYFELAGYISRFATPTGEKDNDIIILKPQNVYDGLKTFIFNKDLRQKNQIQKYKPSKTITELQLNNRLFMSNHDTKLFLRLCDENNILIQISDTRKRGKVYLIPSMIRQRDKIVIEYAKMTCVRLKFKEFMPQNMLLTLIGFLIKANYIKIVTLSKYSAHLRLFKHNTIGDKKDLPKIEDFFVGVKDGCFDFLCYHKEQPGFLEEMFLMIMATDNLWKRKVATVEYEIMFKSVYRKEDVFVDMKTLFKSIQNTCTATINGVLTEVSKKYFEPYQNCLKCLERAPKIFQFEFFLAHTWNDKKKFVNNVKDILKSNGKTVWIDEERLNRFLTPEIVLGVLATRRFCVCLSEDYVNRYNTGQGNVQKELNFIYSIASHDRIVYVTIDKEYSKIEKIIRAGLKKASTSSKVVWAKVDNMDDAITSYLKDYT